MKSDSDTKAEVDRSTGGAQVLWVAEGLAGDLNLYTAQSFVLPVGTQQTVQVAANTKDSKKRSAQSIDDESAKAYWTKYLYDLENEIEVLVNSTGEEELDALQARAKDGDSTALTALGYLYLPSPGFVPRRFIDEAVLTGEGWLTHSPLACFDSIPCLTPVIASGTVLLSASGSLGKLQDRSGYASAFRDKSVIVVDGKL